MLDSRLFTWLSWDPKSPTGLPASQPVQWYQQSCTAPLPRSIRHHMSESHDRLTKLLLTDRQTDRRTADRMILALYSVVFFCAARKHEISSNRHIWSWRRTWSGYNWWDKPLWKRVFAEGDSKRSITKIGLFKASMDEGSTHPDKRHLSLIVVNVARLSLLLQTGEQVEEPRWTSTFQG